MPLTLVTGPANSAKAQIVLERYRAALPCSPILVVPRAADAEHYRRELADSGLVLGLRVEPFSGLMRELARRAGTGARPLGDRAREAVIAAVVGATRLEALAPATRAPAFVAALARFVAELEARRIEPPRLTSALRSWAGAGSRRRAYADDLSALYAAYRQRLERLGRPDAELHALGTLDALVLAPQLWDRTPVFLYGFDDLEPLQVDVVETLAHRLEAVVVVSLPGEPGRVALAGRATTLETLRPGAEELVELEAQATYYEEPALHHLERTLFEADPPRPPADPAIRLLEGGDQRAEAELVAQEIAQLLAGGFAAGDIAIVTRSGGGAGDVLADALDAFAIPHSRTRRERLASSAVGRGLIAALRCAAGRADAVELAAWLRLSGMETDQVDELEAWVRRYGSGSLAEARGRWEREHGRLEALHVLERSGIDGGPALVDAVAEQLESLLAAPWRRAAALIDPWEAASAASVRRALTDLRELARTEPRLLGGLAGIARTLEDTTVELAGAADSAAVSICDALSLRARRVRALFIFSVQDGEFPAGAREPPFLGAAERAELARASGLVLASPPDQLAAERYLFYALCSRPTACLRVSWHTASDDGEPAPASLFIDDLCDCFAPALYDERLTRAAGSLTWPSPSAVPLELRRLERQLAGPRRAGRAIAALRSPADLAALRGHREYSASALEKWASCPVAWLVERALGARALAPDSMYLLRGSEAHDVLAEVFEGLGAEAGSTQLAPDTLPLALELLDRALVSSQRRLSAQPAVDATERRRLRLDLERYLSLAAASPGRYTPARLELAFGFDDAELPAVEVAEGLLLRGRIDRVDVDPLTRTAIVIDYKTGRDAPPWPKWETESKLQQALYMRVAEQLLDVEAVGGLYQPLRSADLRPRGAIREDAEPQGPEPMDGDRIDGESLRLLVDDVIAKARTIAAELERGAVEPRPVSCRDGACLFPTICRCEVA
jgi:ATP-dependent helicase/DNAse subunit B